MITQYLWITVFGLVMYLIIVDESISKLFYYLFKILKFEYEKKKWWLLYSPDNPVVKYLIYRRSLKLAKEIEKELNK